MTKYQGLTTKEARIRQDMYGRNDIDSKKKSIFVKLFHVFTEPIYLLLTCSAMIYFILGERTDGLIMLGFVFFIIGIDEFQDLRTGNAMKKLRELSAPRVPVIRDGYEMSLAREDIVPGDLILISEGVKIPADGVLLEASGICMDESILTGEALPVWKSGWEGEISKLSDLFYGEKEEYYRRDYCYAGTLVILGTGKMIATKTGNKTEYGKIADKVNEVPQNKTQLQLQMRKLAKYCSILAGVLFVLVSGITYLNLSDLSGIQRVIESILAGVVLALSMIPGEFPVILTVFLSLGALKLVRKRALIRHLPCVETLGAVSVLCMDKTGTITQNKQQVAASYIEERQESKFCKILKLTCKEGSYDPVEKAMLDYCEELCKCCPERTDRLKACSLTSQERKLIKDYAFTNEMKAMGQVWEAESIRIIAAKGSPESILSLCDMEADRRVKIEKEIMSLLKKDLRLIAVADRILNAEETIPESLAQCRLYFRGIIGLNDPIRDGMREYILATKKAGVRVIMITGDHPVTAASIAKKVGIEEKQKVLTGEDINALSEEELKVAVTEYNLFARVLPLHKMRIVKALQANGEVVAMTGDGVNDAPAQRLADIGVAMGKHGSEVCREAADLILLDDNYATILDTIEDGRRIYQNILKTIAYVFSIHLPIALISLVGPLFGINPQSLMLLPLHIVLLEMVMDPTCSIVIEHLPAEANIMQKPPRHRGEQLITTKSFFKSMLHGFIIFLASFGWYYLLLKLTNASDIARTAGFVTLVTANILLVISNCSNTKPFHTILYQIRKDRGIWLVNLITLILLGVIVYSPLQEVLGFHSLSPFVLAVSLLLAAASVLWYELVKYINRRIKR